ncbi:hypothetical protein [Pseudanabaena sp. PCC 6802]|nr:hypothetical protein [Pseudanabaena sp. PCC 6802]
MSFVFLSDGLVFENAIAFLRDNFRERSRIYLAVVLKLRSRFC